MAYGTALIIVREGVGGRAKIVRFPWQLASVVRTASLLPTNIWDVGVMAFMQLGRNEKEK